MKINKLFSNSIVYLLSDVISKAVPFLTLPIIISVLSVDEYAEYSLFIQFSNVLMILLGMGAYSAVNMNYFKSWFPHAAYYGVFSVFSLTIFFIFSVVFLTFNMPLWAFSGLFIGLMSFIAQLKLVSLQVSERIFKFLFVQLIRSVGLFGGIALILYFSNVIQTIYYYAITYSVLFIIITLFIDRHSIQNAFRLVPQEGLKIVKQGVFFSFPAFVNSISGWIRNGVDRFFILSVYGLTEVGVLSFIFQLSTVISVIAISMNRAINVHLLRKYQRTSKERSRVICIKYSFYVMTLLMVASLILFQVIFAFSENNIISEYEKGLVALPYFLLSFVIQGGVGVYTCYLQFFGGNKELGHISLIVGVLYIPLSYFAIHNFDFTSVSLVFLCSWIVQLLGCLYLTFRVRNDR